MVDKITEIEIFLDKEKTNKIRDFKIDLGILEAGKEIDIPLFVENKIKFPIKFKFDLVNDELQASDLELTQSFDLLLKNQTKKLILTVKPKITTLKPISATLNVKLEYVVK